MNLRKLFAIIVWQEQGIKSKMEALTIGSGRLEEDDPFKKVNLRKLFDMIAIWKLLYGNFNDWLRATGRSSSP